MKKSKFPSLSGIEQLHVGVVYQRTKVKEGKENTLERSKKYGLSWGGIQIIESERKSYLQLQFQQFPLQVNQYGKGSLIVRTGGEKRLVDYFICHSRNNELGYQLRSIETVERKSTVTLVKKKELLCVKNQRLLS